MHLSMHQIKQAKHAAEHLVALLKAHDSGAPHDPAKVAEAQAAIKAAAQAVLAALESQAQ
jgi:hypothetical protein